MVRGERRTVGLAHDEQADIGKGKARTQPVNPRLEQSRAKEIDGTDRHRDEEDRPQPDPAPRPHNGPGQDREPQTGKGRVTQPPGQCVDPRRMRTAVDQPEQILVDPERVEQRGPPSYTPSMRAFGDGSVNFVRSPSDLLGPYRAVVSERTGGISAPPFATLNVGRSTDDDPGAVRENERIILRSLGLADRVARLRLEHGARVLRPDGPGVYGPADALITDDPQLVLWFTVADCVPVTITAGVWRAHGHCGWRGIVAGLIEAMGAALMRSAGVSPSGLRAWAGPGIGPCCFEAGPEVADRFDRAAIRTAWSGPAAPRVGGTPSQMAVAPLATGHPYTRTFLDLHAEIALRLANLGLPSEAVAADDSCTACAGDRFFSHRRDGIPTGRLAALSFTHPPSREPTGRLGS